MRRYLLLFLLLAVFSLPSYPFVRKGAGKLSLDVGSAADRLSRSLVALFNVPEGRVVLVKGNRVWVRFPKSSALKPGATFVVYKPGAPIVDPETHQRFPGIDEPVGYFRLEEIKKGIAVGYASGEKATYKKGYLVRYPEVINIRVDCSSLNSTSYCEIVKISLMKQPRFAIVGSSEPYAFTVVPKMVSEPSGRVRLVYEIKAPFTGASIWAFDTEVKAVRAVSTAMLLEGGEREKWGRFKEFMASRVFKQKYLIMTSADFDRDGKDELVLVSKKSVDIYKLKGKGFVRFASYKIGKRGEFYSFLRVGTLDMDGDGIPEIYISAVYNDIIDGKYVPEPASFALAYKNGKLKKIKDFKFLIRIAKVDQLGGYVLLGQRLGDYTPFSGPIFRVVYKNGHYAIDNHLPGYIRNLECIYGWALGDVNGDGKEEMALLDEDILRIMTLNGTEIWESAEPLGPFTHLYFYQTPRFATPPTMKNYEPEEIAKKRIVPRKIMVEYFPEENRNAVLTIANDVKKFFIAGVKIATDYEGINGRVVKIEKVSQGTLYSAFFDVVWETQKFSTIYGEDFAVGDFNGDGVLDLAFLGYLKKSGKTRVDVYRLPGM